MPRRFDRVQPFFSALASSGAYGGALTDIVASLAAGTLTPTRHRELFRQRGVRRDETQLKAELDILLAYVRTVLQHGPLSPDDRANIAQLKTILQIREGAFYLHRAAEVSALLQDQMEVTLADDMIDDAEDLQQVALQEIFDLSYDDYLMLVRRPVDAAWERLIGELGEEALPSRRVVLLRKLMALEPIHHLAEIQSHRQG
jgi:hypothetical protein